VSTQPNSFLTPEQYLEIERKAEFKSEYYNGEMFAMAGVSLRHSLIATNLIASLHQQFRGRPCQVHSSDLRVHVVATGLYTYPDVSALCGQPRFVDERAPDTLLNPTVLVEVLSPSTEGYDRGRKFEHYKSIESLAQYVLVATDRLHVDVFTRQADGSWVVRSADQRESTLQLESIGCKLALTDVYDKVEF
jgi:Uma2 family endonuclease